jgi:hypothetical protein
MKMARLFWLIAFAASPSLAQSVNTYVCQPDPARSQGYRDTVLLKFGPGEVRIFAYNEWSENYCVPGGACSFQGTHFDGYDPDGFALKYDASTGSFEYSDAGGLDVKGVCRPQ